MVRNSMPIQSVVFGPDFSLDKVEFDLHTSDINKPKRAMWTSSYDPEWKSIGWIAWNLAEQTDMLKDCLYRIVPKKRVKVYEIDTVEDWLSARLPKIEKRNPIQRFLFGRLTTEGFIDFVDLAKRGYDGVHVTHQGAMIGHDFSANREAQRSLYSYDCESTVWFNTNWIKSVELVASDLKSKLNW